MRADGDRVEPGPAGPGREGASPGWGRNARSLLLAVALAAASQPTQAGEADPAAAIGAPAPWAPSDLGMDLTFAPDMHHWPPSTVLEQATTLDSEAARALAQPSIGRTARLDHASRIVELDRFGRRVDAELGAALAPVAELILDLRHNHGGSVRRMLRVAARFTGPVPDALRLIADDGVTVLAIPDPKEPVWQGRLTVLVGDDTISSGEVLAALLRRFAHAAVLGQRTWGKDFAMRVVMVDPDWRALVPAGRIEVPGEALHGGLLPDAPIPPDLLARIADHRPDHAQTSGYGPDSSGPE